MSRILLIEDEVNVSAFIKRGLEEQAYQVDVAYDGVTGKSLVLQKRYDVIILDVILPNSNGWEVCKSIRALRITTPILMLSALGTTDDKVKGLNLGADDYLTKPFKFKELQARINALGRRKYGSGEDLITIGSLEVNLAAKPFTGKAAPLRLPPRNLNCWSTWPATKGRVLSRMQLLENVWEKNFDPGSNVGEVYVNYLRNKIDKHCEAKLIHTVIGMGYVLKDSGQA
jgi:DNA-binding response OmpR family regulator